jgi:hypothetical protein
METSGQLHSLAALSSVKEPRLFYIQEASWASDPIWMLRRREKCLSLPESTPDFAVVTIFLELSYVFQCMQFTNVIRAIKLWGVSWKGHIACVGKIEINI